MSTLVLHPSKKPVRPSDRKLPTAQYTDLRLPDGTHSGARYDPGRGVLEIQRRGIRYYFDLTMLPVAIHENS